jgi:uncharacterized protein YecE (DUF72 family)
VRGWKQQTPPGFVFALKASRLITHMRKLRGCGEALAALFGVMDNLGEKLGPILFQLPPRWRVDHRRLEEFIRGLPAEHRYSFEFRDLSWHDERVYELLSACNVALCHYHLEGFESPAVATADFGYWRLHGPGAAYRGCYSDEYLGQLSDRLKSDHDQYVFFDNDEAGYAVRNALRLQALCDARRD